jgi:hypothetical protein
MPRVAAMTCDLYRWETPAALLVASTLLRSDSLSGDFAATRRQSATGVATCTEEWFRLRDGIGNVEVTRIVEVWNLEDPLSILLENGTEQMMLDRGALGPSPREGDRRHAPRLLQIDPA